MAKQKNKRKNDRLAGIFQQGEEILWQGRPNLNKHFSSHDLYLIPFSLMWGGFACFWGFSVLSSGAPLVFRLWGVPFVVIGLYMIFGRFVHKYLRKRQTRYFVTDKRVIAVNEFMGFKVKTYYIRALNELSINGSNVLFSLRRNPYTAHKQGANWGVNDDDGFHEIDDAREVYELILSLQGEKAKRR